jgi:hypothetical protein
MSLILNLEKSFEEIIDRVLLDEENATVPLSVRVKLVKKLSEKAVEITSVEKPVKNIASLHIDLKKQLVQRYLVARDNLTNIFRKFSLKTESSHVELKEEKEDTENSAQLMVRNVYSDEQFLQESSPIPVREAESSAKNQSDEKFQIDDSVGEFRLSTPDFDTIQKAVVQESQQ